MKGVKASPPDQEAFTADYNAGMSQIALSRKYQCSKKLVRSLILSYGLPLRIVGGGNNRKYFIDKDYLKSLVDSGMTNIQIGLQENIRTGSVGGWMKRYGIKRTYNMTEFQIYNNKVRRLSESQYVKHKNILNPNNHPRTLCGVDGGYQLDHINSVRACFDAGVSVEECSHLSNLQFIPWQLNLAKRCFVSGRSCDDE